MAVYIILSAPFIIIVFYWVYFSIESIRRINEKRCGMCGSPLTDSELDRDSIYVIDSPFFRKSPNCSQCIDSPKRLNYWLWILAGWAMFSAVYGYLFI